MLWEAFQWLTVSTTHLQFTSIINQRAGNMQTAERLGDATSFFMFNVIA